MMSPTSERRTAASTTIPLFGRLGHEIPKPIDWPAFQRKCVLLFQCELSDPNTKEYGRNGQSQGGIDILGKRDGNPDHYVGVQCRLHTKPLKEAKILADCRAALGLEAGLKEIIFATTAPNDTHASDAAIRVGKQLRGEGYSLTVEIYGWEALQVLIAKHETAYAAFCPSIVGTSAQQTTSENDQLASSSDNLANQIAALVVEKMKQDTVIPPPADIVTAESADEDPALHAKIDVFRDLLTKQRLPILAENGLLEILNSESLDSKPWARFRIETNLGSVALDLGRIDEGATRFENAYNIRPNDSKAIANLALVRTIQGKYDVAMSLATQALEMSPRAEHAVSYLLQAAAQSDWQGEPETLIPLDLRETKDADIGLAEFLRRRDVHGWAERTIEICRRHEDVDEFKRIKAIAVLSLSLDAGMLTVGGQCPVSIDDLNGSADYLKARAEHCLDIGFADEHDLNAYLNNAAVLLRLCNRHAECERLLKKGSLVVKDDPQLRRLLALAQDAIGLRSEALETLAADEDTENTLLRAELTAENDPAAALVSVTSIDPAKLTPRLAHIRFGLMSELALLTKDSDVLRTSVAGLREIDPNDITASLQELRSEKAYLDEETIKGRLRGIAGTMSPDASAGDLFMLAKELYHEGLPDEAARVLEPQIDLTRHCPATNLYLECLASARRDEAFRKALAAVPRSIRESPKLLWTAAIHAWNIGDLRGSQDVLDALLRQVPDNARARLLKIEILIRQNSSAELLAELDKPIEKLSWTRLKDRFRVATLLGYFGYMERAVELAYRLFLEHRDNSQAWMTFSMLVLREGMGSPAKQTWKCSVVAANVAVDLQFNDGQTQFIIVEPDHDLRRLDNESWEPDHPLIRALDSLAAGDSFTDHNGREGTIVELRHKYVARLHYVMSHHDKRFPQIFGFRGLKVDPEQPDGLNELIEELRSRHEWIKEEQERYLNGDWPLGILAHRVGLDVVEVSHGLASQGLKLKVALGSEAERKSASLAISNNSREGCVLDLLAFWTAWKLQALDAVLDVCGPIHLPQSVMDSLRTRQAKINESVHDGLRSAHYEQGKIAVQEVTPEIVCEWRDEIDQAIAWTNANALIDPVVAVDSLPTSLREFLQEGQTDVLDSTVLAMQKHLLLISDDLPTRNIFSVSGGKGAAWLHAVINTALDRRIIDLSAFVRWSAYLVDAGHDYLGISGPALAHALRMDVQDGCAPGYLFTTLAKVIGGKNADPHSHILACLLFLEDVWRDPKTLGFRKAATGLLLRQLIRERSGDYGQILAALVKSVRNMPQLLDYIQAWAKGHFVLDAIRANLR